MRRPEIVERIRQALKQVAPTARAILYGSEARGDIDLLILVDGDKLSIADEMEITSPLYDIQFETGILISPLVFLKKMWHSRPFATPFTDNVAQDGILLA